MFEWLDDLENTASELWGGVKFNDAMLVLVIQDRTIGQWVTP
jgi:hypothetical protein